MRVIRLCFVFFPVPLHKYRHYNGWLQWRWRACLTHQSASLNAVQSSRSGDGREKGGHCVKGSQWMSPLIHFLIKQPVLCPSHGLSLSSYSVLWADAAHTGSQEYMYTPHTSTHTDTAYCAVWKWSPLGRTGIISRRWFMMEIGNLFSRTTWVTSFSRPENKYRAVHHALA